jgi:hypothetical protein
MLLAFGPAVESPEIVAVEISATGYLTITIELEIGEQIIVLPPAAVSEELRTLMLERAA